MLVEKTIGGLKFRIAKGEYGGHSHAVKRDKSVIFGAFKIGTKVFSHLDVPLDLVPQFEKGREIEIFTTVIGSKQSLIAVSIDGVKTVSMNYRDLDQESVGAVMLGGLIGMACGMYGAYASSSGYSTSVIGLILSFIVLIPSACAVLVSIWYSSTTTDINRATKELSS